MSDSNPFSRSKITCGQFPSTNFYSHKFRHHFYFPDLPNSMETYFNVGQNSLAAFPDVKVDLQTLLADGDRVVRNAVTVTHKGCWAGIEATNRSIVGNR